MTGKHKILIIDDSKETVSGLKSFFNDKYETATAGNGLVAFKSCGIYKFGSFRSG